MRSMLHYSPLDAEQKEIRLLKKGHASSLSFSLTTFPFERAPSYDCLSYEWGNDRARHPILVNGQSFEVLDNLHKFLNVYQGLKSEEHSSFIWIDQICIDQDNESEKSTQVQFMGEIYSKAERVFAWVGEEDEASRSLRRTIQQLDVISNPQDRQECIYAMAPRFRPFFERSYWYRLWVFQELSLAQRVVAVCGTQTFPWIDISALTKANDDSEIWSVSYNDRIMFHQVVLEAETLSDLLHAFHKAATFGGTNFDEKRLSETWQCQRKEDRIYGMLGILPPQERVTVDYGRTYNELVDAVVLKGMESETALLRSQISWRGDEGDNAEIEERLRHLRRVTRELLGLNGNDATAEQ